MKYKNNVLLVLFTFFCSLMGIEVFLSFSVTMLNTFVTCKLCFGTQSYWYHF